jgi:hypothetical protein
MAYAKIVWFVGAVCGRYDCRKKRASDAGYAERRNFSTCSVVSTGNRAETRYSKSTMGEWWWPGICIGMDVAQMSSVKVTVPDTPTDNFENAEWAQLTEPLRQFASQIKSETVVPGVKVRASSRWPTIRFERRRCWYFKVLSLQLQSNYLIDGIMKWELQLQEGVSFWVFYQKHFHVEMLKNYQGEQIAADKFFVTQLMPIIQEYLKP